MKFAHKKRVIAVVRCAVAISLMAFLVKTVGVDQIANTFLTMNPTMGILAGLCLGTLFFLGGFNIWLLLSSIHAISFINFLKVYMASWVTGLIVPGQAGDASIIIFLNKEGIEIKKIGSIYMLDKAITLGFFLVVSFVGAHRVIPDYHMSFNGIIFPLIFFVTIGLILWALSSIVPLIAKIRSKCHELWYSIKNFIGKKWYLVAFNITFTIIKWVFTSLGFYFAFMAYGVQVDIYTISVLPILSTLVGYIPISIAGLGTVEVTATYLFSLVGIQQAIVLNAYLLLRILQYGLAIFFLTVMTFFFKPRQ